MGGNALQTVVVSRLNKCVYETLKTKIYNKMNHIFEMEFLHEIPEKEDFGDLDILYVASQTYNLYDVLQEQFHPVEIVKNGPVTSFAYTAECGAIYQIDFIKTSNMKMSKYYMSYGSFGNILGRIMSFYNLRFGIQGLFVKVVFPQSSVDIVLSNDPVEICRYWGVEYCETFATSRDMFQFVCSISFFHPSIFQIGHQDDKKKTKRPMYTAFLQYIRDEFVPTAVRPEPEDKMKHALLHFNKMLEYETYCQNWDKQQRIKEKVNVHLFLSAGYCGKELSVVMRKFKQTISESWLLETSQEDVENAIIEFLRTEKNTLQNI
jgi:hypothetical protein